MEQNLRQALKTHPAVAISVFSVCLATKMLETSLGCRCFCRHSARSLAIIGLLRLVAAMKREFPSVAECLNPASGTRYLEPGYLKALNENPMLRCRGNSEGLSFFVVCWFVVWQCARWLSNSSSPAHLVLSGRQLLPEPAV